MAKSPAWSVTYPVVRRGKEYAVEFVNLRTDEYLDRFGPSVCRAISAAYSQGHEEPNGPLKPGTVKSRFGPKQESGWIARAREHRRKGSQYWVAIAAGQTVTSFVKTSPGEILSDPQPGMVYVNDVVTRPPATSTSRTYQRHGFAFSGLHAALKFGGYDLNSGVFLDAFDASESRMEEGFLVPGPNNLYAKMGLVAVGPSSQFPFPDETELFMTEYRTPDGVTLGDVVKRMESFAKPEKPQLHLGVPQYGLVLDN